jgi:hypothetical protein
MFLIILPLFNEALTVEQLSFIQLTTASIRSIQYDEAANATKGRFSDQLKNKSLFNF